MTSDELLTEFDDFGSDPDPELDVEGGLASTSARRSLPALIWATVRHPTSALAEVAERGRWMWLVPVLAIAVCSTVASVVSMPRAREAAMVEMERQMERASGDMSEEEAAQFEATREQTLGIMFRVTGIFSVVGAILSPFIAALVVAAVLHLGGTVVGGQQTFGQMLAVVSWARWPLAFQAMARLVHSLTGGYDLRMNGLAGLVDSESALSPLLAEISIWNVWALVLTVTAVGVVSRVARGKAIAVVAALVILRVLLGELGVAVGRFAAGFGGG